MQLEDGIRFKRRGAEIAELRRGAAAEVPQMVSSDGTAKICVSPRSQRLCVKISPASTAWTRLSAAATALWISAARQYSRRALTLRKTERAASIPPCPACGGFQRFAQGGNSS